MQQMTRRLSDVQRFWLDALALLGLPALLLAGLIAWWRPWELFRPPLQSQEVRSADDLRAIQAALRDTTWNRLHIVVPSTYVLAVTSNRVDVIEVTPSLQGKATWPGRLAFLPLSAAAEERFRQAAGNCSLAPGRCWSDTLAVGVVACQQSSGSPDPELSWTPHVECQFPGRGVRGAINAPSDQSLTLLALFDSALVRPVP